MVDEFRVESRAAGYRSLTETATILACFAFPCKVPAEAALNGLLRAALGSFSFGRAGDDALHFITSRANFEG